MTTETLDQERVEAFAGKAIGDLAGANAAVLCILGDRLGLFTALARAARRPVTSSPSAPALTNGYAREWLAGLAAAGYLEAGFTSLRTLPLEDPFNNVYEVTP